VRIWERPRFGTSWSGMIKRRRTIVRKSKSRRAPFMGALCRRIALCAAQLQRQSHGESRPLPCPEPFDEPLVLWHLSWTLCPWAKGPRATSTGPRDKGLRTALVEGPVPGFLPRWCCHAPSTSLLLSAIPRLVPPADKRACPELVLSEVEGPRRRGLKISAKFSSEVMRPATPNSISIQAALLPGGEFGAYPHPAPLR